MINKFIIFGSCNSAGVELWYDKTIPNYSKMDPIMAAVRSDFLVYADHVQNEKPNENIKNQIDYETNNSWVKKLKENFPNSEVVNISVAQSNLKNFLKASTYLYQNNIDKKSTCIIIEMTEPTGLTLCQNNILKSYGKPHLEFFLGKQQKESMDAYLDTYENERHRAYIDLITLYNLIGNLRYQGYIAHHFIWDRDPWIKLLRESKPIRMFMPENNNTDVFDELFFSFFEDSLISKEQEQELKKFLLYPQGHFVPEAHEKLGEYISTKLKEII